MGKGATAEAGLARASKAILRAGLLAAALAIAASAGTEARDHRGSGREFVELPGTSHKLKLGSLGGELDGDLIEALTRWIVANSDLPPAPAPLIQRLPATPGPEPALTTQERSRTASAGFRSGASLLSLYDESSRTIFLHKDWRGSDYGELSVLVHELTHHLQNVAGRVYACSNEREKLAYRLQEKWLNHFRRSLASEFNLDPFRMLLKSACLF